MRTSTLVLELETETECFRTGVERWGIYNINIYMGEGHTLQLSNNLMK